MQAHKAEALTLSNLKKVGPDYYIELFVEFLLTHEQDQLLKLLYLKTGREEHIAFNVSAHDIIHFDSALAFGLLYMPRDMLPLFDTALQIAQSKLCFGEKNKLRKEKSNQNNIIGSDAVSVKNHTHIRIFSLPPVRQLCKDTIGEIRSSDSDALIQIAGTVVRTGSVRLLEVSKKYRCMNPKCGFEFQVFADPEQVPARIYPLSNSQLNPSTLI